MVCQWTDWNTLSHFKIAEIDPIDLYRLYSEKMDLSCVWIQTDNTVVFAFIQISKQSK